MNVATFSQPPQQEAKCFSIIRSMRLVYPNLPLPYIKTFTYLLSNIEIELTTYRENLYPNIGRFKYCTFSKSLRHVIEAYW